MCLVYPECYDVARFGDIRKEFPPFGVMYLASALEEKGYSVKIIATSVENNSFDFSEFDLVGFSISSSVAYPLILETRKNSKYKEGATIIAGGIHATLYPIQVLKEMDIDIVSIGEGEVTVCDIVSHLKDKKYSNIKGICYQLNGSIIVTSKQEIIDNLDQISFPARHLLPEENIIMKRLATTKLPIAHVLFTRGCPYHCNFCANLNHNIQYRSKENIIEELEQLIRNYDIKGFCVTDDNFLCIKNKAIPIIDEIAKLNLKWSTLARVDNVDLELLQKLKESGCVEIKFGVESGSQTLLNSMKKGITIEQIKEAFYLAKKVGIEAKALIMHGYPGESEKTTNETIALLDNLKKYISRVGLTYFTYLPGSNIYEEQKPNVEYNCGVYCENQVPWGNEEEQRIVINARRRLKGYINENFYMK